MINVKMDHITHLYGTQLVLDDVAWELHSGQRVGLVGANGAGKSTLLGLIEGRLVPETGSIFRHKEARVGYLAQEPELNLDLTVWEEALSAAGELLAVEAELRRLEGRMADPEIHSDETLLRRTLNAYARAQERFERMDGYAHESRVREGLFALGFEERDLSLPVGALSGGQKKMLGMAKLLSMGANLLLLDEPDNHLDVARKEQLAAFIDGFDGTVVIVSHDRYLLDEVATHIVEVDDHKLHTYIGNYTTFAVEKELRQLQQLRHYQAQQKEIARIEAAIARFELWASLVPNARHARQARSRHKMLERMDKIDKPIMERRKMGLQLNGWRGSNKVIEITDLDKVFGDADGEKIVLAGLDLLLWHGEKVGLLGPNGAGKSVLMRCLTGEMDPTSGRIIIGPSVRAGYYAQEHETLDPNATLVEEIRRAKAMYEDQAVAFLGGFLFPYEWARKQVCALSGGERSRLQLAKLMLSDANLLLLDEPTNNLDLPSCEVLENALDAFEGTVLVISHDRYFLDRVVDRVVELDEGMLEEYVGGYSDYVEQKAKRVKRRSSAQPWPRAAV